RPHLRRNPGTARPALDPAGPEPAGHRPDPLPPARRPGRGPRPPAARGGGPHRRTDRRLLRPGRQLRLRVRPLRGVGGVRGGGPSSLGARGTRGRDRPGRRLLLPHPAPPTGGRAGPPPGGGAGAGAGGLSGRGAVAPGTGGARTGNGYWPPVRCAVREARLPSGSEPVSPSGVTPRRDAVEDPRRQMTRERGRDGVPL